jgi:hypothetical protein
MRKLSLLLLLLAPAAVARQAAPPAGQLPLTAIDRDLLDVSVDRLHQLYLQHRYTVTQVVQWHLDRIARYNGIYRPVQTGPAP